MTAAGALQGPVGPLAAFLAYLVAERLLELWLSARHERYLVARGGVRAARDRFALLAAIHTLFPLALATEVLSGAGSPDPGWPLWLAMLFGAQALRAWAIAALGFRWSVRVWVVPGMEPVQSGPYRFLRHPNYLAVAVELVAGSLMFGAWRTAVAISALNLVALSMRVRTEERALEWARNAHASNP